MKELEIQIDNEGNVQIEALGFTGPSCLEATKKWLALLGGEQQTIPKPEMQQRTVTNENKVTQ